MEKATIIALHSPPKAFKHRPTIRLHGGGFIILQVLYVGGDRSANGIKTADWQFTALQRLRICHVFALDPATRISCFDDTLMPGFHEGSELACLLLVD